MIVRPYVNVYEIEKLRFRNRSQRCPIAAETFLDKKQKRYDCCWNSGATRVPVCDSLADESHSSCRKTRRYEETQGVEVLRKSVDQSGRA